LRANLQPEPDGFDELAGHFFSREELADLLSTTLTELEGFADASCENTPGGPDCGHCSVCSARKVIDDIDAETRRRRRRWAELP
jgi:hypothetical protein